jgi:hypothetical protein
MWAQYGGTETSPQAAADAYRQYMTPTENVLILAPPPSPAPGLDLSVPTAPWDLPGSNSSSMRAKIAHLTPSLSTISGIALRGSKSTCKLSMT